MNRRADLVRYFVAALAGVGLAYYVRALFGWANDDTRGWTVVVSLVLMFAGMLGAHFGLDWVQREVKRELATQIAERCAFRRVDVERGAYALLSHDEVLAASWALETAEGFALDLGGVTVVDQDESSSHEGR